MKPAFAVLCVAAAAQCACGPAPVSTQVSRASLDAVPAFGDNPGQLELFVHVPPTLPPRPALVVALHGCTQTASDYTNAGWSELSDRYGFLVAYPQANDNGRCFRWFEAAQQARTGPQVTSMVNMVQHLVATHNIDANRVFVTGLSAGAAMTAVLLATSPDVFSGGGIVAGVPFGCATSIAQSLGCMTFSKDLSPQAWAALVAAAGPAQARPPRVSIWHGISDLTVSVTNQVELVEQWAGVNGIDAEADDTTTMGQATHRQYRDGAGSVRVESWRLQGFGHASPVSPPECGAVGSYAVAADVCASAQLVTFFGLDVAAATPDAGPTALDAGLRDGGSGGDAGSVTPPSCGCATGGVSPMALVFALALARFRRKR